VTRINKAVGPPKRAVAMDQEVGWAVQWAHGGGKHTFIPELDGGAALLQYQRMRRRDETIGAIFWVLNSTLAQLPWRFQPCVDGIPVSRNDPDFDTAQDWADFVQGCLTDMDHSWEDHVEEAVVMAWAGFAPCEIVFKERDGEASRFDDGKWGFKRLPLRDPLTVWDFDTNEKNELALMRQRTLDGKTADIPLWKVLHYRMSRVLDDPWGASLLENAYRPWFLKQRIQESEAIGIDRELCGMPTMRVPGSELQAASDVDAGGNATPKAQAARTRLQAAMNAVTKMRFNEVGGLMIPSDPFEDGDGKPTSVRKWDFELIHSTGQRAIDARTAARDYDRAMARTVLMQFLHLGDRSGGSFGLSNDQSTMAIRSIMWVAKRIAAEFNLKAVRLLWLLNAAPMKFMPKLEPGQLSDDSIEKLGQFISDMADATALFDEDPALKDSVLDRAGLKGLRDQYRNVKSIPRDKSPFREPDPPQQPSLFGGTANATRRPAAAKKPAAKTPVAKTEP
jgi:hypothetical protein